MKIYCRFFTNFFSLSAHPSLFPGRFFFLQTLVRPICTNNIHVDDEIHDSYNDPLPKISKLANRVKHFDVFDGILFDFEKNVVTIDEDVEKGVREFKSLTRDYLCSSGLLRFHMDGNCSTRIVRDHDNITLSSLTPICAFLKFTVKQRKLIRVTACKQVTQPQIWIGALMEILRLLKHDLETFGKHFTPESVHMGLQIASLCLNLFDNTCGVQHYSWMHLSPVKRLGVSYFRTWGDVLDVFDDLIEVLKGEKKLHFYVAKLESMKEGLYQLQNVVMYRGNGYKRVGKDDGLVQKILAKALGHSSNCLFTLLMYYLYGSVRNIEVEVFGGVYRVSKKKYRLCMARILASDEDKMVWSGVKQLYKALGLVEFVWKSVGLRGELELQGHLWCHGADRRLFTYRGVTFSVHDIGYHNKVSDDSRFVVVSRPHNTNMSNDVPIQSRSSDM